MNGNEAETVEASYLVFEPIFYGVMIGAGAISCFFGFRLFKLMVAVLAGFLGALAGAALGYQLGEDPLVWTLIFLFVGGVVGALMGFFFFSLALAFAGSSLGVVLSLPWVGHMENPLWQLLTMLGVAMLFALIAVIAVNLVIRLGTAYIGAFGMVYGTWFFIGGPAIHELLKDSESIIPVLAANPIPAVIMMVVGTVGLLVQSRS